MSKTIAILGALTLCGCSASFSAGSGKPSSPDGKPAQGTSPSGAGKAVGSTDTQPAGDQGTAPAGGGADGSGTPATTEMAAKGPEAKHGGKPDCIPGEAKGHEKDKAQGEAKGHDLPPCPDEADEDDKSKAGDPKASASDKAAAKKK